MKGANPTVLIVGAAKCGTTALHRFLDLHPRIAMSSPKELNYFVADEDLEDVQLPAVERRLLPRTRNWGRRDAAWYRSKFDPRFEVRGESSVAYSSPWHRPAAARAAELVPSARIVFCVRDPIERIRSQFGDNRAKGIERRELREALSCEPSTYLGRTAYAAGIEPWIAAFGRSSVFVVRQEELRADPSPTLASLHRFLGVDPFDSPLYTETVNSSATKGRRAAILARLRRVRGGRALDTVSFRTTRLLAALTRSRRDHLPRLDDPLAAELRRRLDPEMRKFAELTGVSVGDLGGLEAGSTEA